MTTESKIQILICSPTIGERESELVNQCIKEGWISGISPYVEKFENTFARYCGCKYK